MSIAEAVVSPPPPPQLTPPLAAAAAPETQPAAAAAPETQGAWDPPQFLQLLIILIAAKLCDLPQGSHKASPIWEQAHPAWVDQLVAAGIANVDAAPKLAATKKKFYDVVVSDTAPTTQVWRTIDAIIKMGGTSALFEAATACQSKIAEFRARVRSFVGFFFFFKF